MSSIDPFIYFLRILGLTPVRFVNVSGIMKITFSTPMFLYSIILLVILVPASIFALVIDMDEFQNNRTLKITSNTAGAVCIVDIFGLFQSAIISVTFNALYCKRIIRLLDRIQTIDKFLKCSHQLRKCSIVTSIFIVLFAILVIIDVMNWFAMNKLSLYYLPVYFFHCMIIAAECAYANLVWGLKERFYKLNKEIKQVFKRHDRYEFGDNILPEIANIKVKPAIKRNIAYLTNLHWSLCRIVEEVNVTFGFQTLHVMLCIFLHIIITPYFFFLGILNPSKYGRGNTWYLILQAVWGVFHVLQLFIIVWPCAMSTNEANKIAYIIGQQLGTSKSSSFQNEVESCVIQLMHHHAEFSVCGLFNINLPVITAVIGAVTTYLVILIQF